MGYGDHWRLDDSEASDLGGKLADVTEGMGTNPYFEKMMQLVGTVGPWVSLIGTAAIITMPRVAITKAMMMEAQRQKAVENEPETAPNGDGPAAYSNGRWGQNV